MAVQLGYFFLTLLCWHRRLGQVFGADIELSFLLFHPLLRQVLVTPFLEELFWADFSAVLVELLFDVRLRVLVKFLQTLVITLGHL